MTTTSPLSITLGICPAQIYLHGWQRDFQGDIKVTPYRCGKKTSAGTQHWTPAYADRMGAGRARVLSLAWFPRRFPHGSEKRINSEAR